ncbi:hypothetical protein P8936_12325 [Edaphobacter paludis]|uniref:DUF3800 domain-containing protein n=1 Tax=Edaphobacter paludis TaxID=3035702 RepID=A0AAU7D4K5_9BACT
MSRVILLDPSHWAGKWTAPDEDQHYDLKTVNLLGYEYGIASDSTEKEAKLLQLLEYFHGYLMKYVLMIQWGTIPPANSRAGKDAKQLLRTLAPRGSKPSQEQTNASCKMLHLAFKGQTTEEIYDTLAFCFMKAARRYDPYYSDKTKRVCEEVHGLPQEFSQIQLGERVDFNCTGILRALVRKDFLASITEKKKVVGYKTGPKWPPPASYFQSGPVGFVYMLQMWFRYCVNECIIGYRTN